MHPSARTNFENFVSTYIIDWSQQTKLTMIEIGSQDVNGSLRDIVPPGIDYVGVDFASGCNVDIVLTDPYQLPIESNSVDIVVSSSCFEHSEMFWLTFLEMMRVLKNKGLCYIQAPSNGPFHRYPVDCWRFYPDSGRALNNWANKNNMNSSMLESYISDKVNDVWCDFVAVFLKDRTLVDSFPKRILDNKKDIINGLVNDSEHFINYRMNIE